MEENVKSNNNNNPSQIKIPPGFGKISDGLDREKVDTFAYQEQSKVQKLVLKAKKGANNLLSLYNFFERKIMEGRRKKNNEDRNHSKNIENYRNLMKNIENRCQAPPPVSFFTAD